MTRPALVLLDQTPEEGPTWVHLIRAGEHYPRSGGEPVVLSRKDLADAVAGFGAAKAEGWWPRGAPLGYNHAAARGATDPDSTAAAGYITDARLSDDGDSIEVCVDWTPTGRARVRGGDFQALSAELIFDPASKTTGKPLAPAAIVGATLTNDPMVTGLRRVAASETPPKEPAMKRTATLLGLAETVTPTDDQIAIALSERDGKIATLAEREKVLLADLTAERAKVAAFGKAEEGRVIAAALADGRIKDTDTERRVFLALAEADRDAVFPRGRVTGAAVVASGSQSQGKGLSLAERVNQRAVEIAKAGGRTAATYHDICEAQTIIATENADAFMAGNLS